jgi:ABC-2 type transport system ATP-binding protein
MTVFLTTHLMEEADQICDRVAIIDHGKILRIGTLSEIKQVVGSDVIELTMDIGSDEVSRMISNELGGQVERKGATYRIKVTDGEEAIPSIIDWTRAKGYKVRRVSVSKPSLAEAYLELTGRAFREEDTGEVQTARMGSLFG